MARKRPGSLFAGGAASPGAAPLLRRAAGAGRRGQLLPLPGPGRPRAGLHAQELRRPVSIRRPGGSTSRTIKFTLIVLAITFVLGFWISYFLVFHVRNLLTAIGLFLVCTVPFWTSNIIRMISWRPVLGKEGLINQRPAPCSASSTSRWNWLLFSDFSVVVAYVHLFTLFMIVPIFNSMARIDPVAARSRRRRRRQPLGGGLERRAAALQDRHRARRAVRGDAGDGRFLRRHA